MNRLYRYAGRLYREAGPREELMKALQQGRLAPTVRSLHERGLLKDVLPEIEALRGVEQPELFHAEGDVFEHTMLVLENAKPTQEAQLAALLHDAGKPATQGFLGDRISFLGHEKVSAEIAEAVRHGGGPFPARCPVCPPRNRCCSPVTSSPVHLSLGVKAERRRRCGRRDRSGGLSPAGSGG